MLSGDLCLPIITPKRQGGFALVHSKALANPKNVEGGDGHQQDTIENYQPTMICYSVTFIFSYCSLMNPQSEHSTSEGLNFLLLRAAQRLYFVILVRNGGVFSCHLSHWDCWHKYLFEEEMNQDLLHVSFAVIFISLLISHNYICHTLTGVIYTKWIISKYIRCDFYLGCSRYSQGASVLQEGWFS